jgi:hypothetical protein
MKRNELITDAELDASAQRYPAAAQAVEEALGELDPTGFIRALFAGSTFAQRMADNPGFVVTPPGEVPPASDFESALEAITALSRKK